jgi:hypothetical protein
MSKTIEARAVISAQDKTGSVFDRLAQKFRGVEKEARALSGIKPLRFTGNLEEELRRLKLTERELQSVRKAQSALQSQLLADPVGRRASNYFRALDDWKSRTVNHWREVKANVDETEKSHRRFFASAGRFALMAGGGIGAAYAVGQAARAGAKAAAESQREGARDYLAGLTDTESERLKDEAQLASSRYRSVDATTMHERLRDTAMSTRSVDKAMELSDVIAQGTTVLQSLKGKDQAIEEGRKFFSALDVLGKNIDPKEVKELFDGYIKALGVEGADMDLGGALSFARQSRAAGGALSNRFLMTTAPGLMRDLGDPQLGTALATALSQNIGGRATKESKATQQAYGLRDANGKFLNSDLAIRDPDKWAWDVLMPALQKKGVDVNDNLKVTEAVSKLFSNRVVGDVFSKLITQREQYQAKAEQYGKAPGLSAAGALPGKDPFVAWESAAAQLRNVAAALDTVSGASVKATSGLTSLAEGASSLTTYLRTGKWPQESIDKWTQHLDSGAYRDGLGGILQDEMDRKRALDALPAWTRSPQLNQKPGDVWDGAPRGVAPTAPGPTWGMLPHMMRKPMAAPEVSQTMTYGTGASSGGDRNISVSGEVTGEAQVKVIVEAGSSLIEAKRQAETAMKLVGQLTRAFQNMNSNGVGSIGRSSPDAAAPSIPYAGSANNLPL